MLQALRLSTKIRPFGCALFFIAIDPAGTQIYTTSPSGIYRSFKCYALGSGEASAREYLKEHYKEGLNFNEVMNLTLNALKESIDEEATKENIRLSYIKTEDKMFHMCSKDEVGKYLAALPKKTKEESV
jgi:20S proteasome alpha/beta subunit